MASITRKEQLPVIARPIAELIEQHGEAWVYELEQSVAEIGDGIQVREDAHDRPPEEVEQYKNDMVNGCRFPPVVLTSDRRVVDGNTRVKALALLNQPTAEAFILRSTYGDPRLGESADQRHRQARLRLLGATLNRTAGKRLTRAELHEAVKFALLDGYDTERVVQVMHVEKNYAANIAKEVRAEQYAAQQGIDLQGLGDVSRRALGMAVPDLEPGVWAELAKLAVDADLGSSDITALAASLRQRPEPNEQRLILEQERESRAQAIALHRQGRDAGKDSDPGVVRRQVMWLVNHAEEAERRVERNPMKQAGHLDMLRRVERAAMMYRQAQEAHMKLANDPIFELNV